MRNWIAALAGAVMLLGPAQAADDTTFDYFTNENVRMALTELGATDIQTVKGEKSDGITAKFGEYTLAMNVQGCEAGGCTRFLVGIAFSTDGRDIPGETLLAFTRKFPPTPAVRIGKGVGLYRALISNGGMRLGNLKANIAMLVSIIPSFIQDMNSATVASSGGAPALMTAPRAPLRPMAVTPTQVKEWELP